MRGFHVARFALLLPTGVCSHCAFMTRLQGFLPESADRFATDVIYPAFSPQMGVFFVCSTAYGVWKVC